MESRLLGSIEDLKISSINIETVMVYCESKLEKRLRGEGMGWGE